MKIHPQPIPIKVGQRYRNLNEVISIITKVDINKIQYRFKSDKRSYIRETQEVNKFINEGYWILLK